MVDSSLGASEVAMLALHEFWTEAVGKTTVPSSERKLGVARSQLYHTENGSRR